MNKPLFLLAGSALLLAGCAGAPVHGPTHRWVAETPVPKPAYLRDNAACEARSGFGGSGTIRSASFQNYRQCMSDAGYRMVAL
ncbi:MAG: hypothetical protein AB1651_03435 [Pseudomonadota bacterium]|jgi:hypothetical protein